MLKGERVFLVLCYLAFPLIYPTVILETWNDYYVRKHYGYILGKGI